MADLRQEFPHVKATAFPVSIAPAYHKIRYTDNEMKTENYNADSEWITQKQYFFIHVLPFSMCQ